VFTSSIGMDHTLKSLANSKVQWRVNYSQSERNEPDPPGVCVRGNIGDPGSVLR